VNLSLDSWSLDQRSTSFDTSKGVIVLKVIDKDKLGKFTLVWLGSQVQNPFEGAHLYASGVIVIFSSSYILLTF
jgi:hypothetical protein